MKKWAIIFARCSYYFGYDKKWFHIRNIKFRSNLEAHFEYFYQKLSQSQEKWQTTPRLKTTDLVRLNRKDSPVSCACSNVTNAVISRSLLNVAASH